MLMRLVKIWLPILGVFAACIVWAYSTFVPYRTYKDDRDNLAKSMERIEANVQGIYNIALQGKLKGVDKIVDLDAGKNGVPSEKPK